MKVDLIITRHPALIELMRERGIAGDSTCILPHATIDDVRGMHVAGVLPYDLAAAARTVTQIPLAITPEERGVELTVERLREIAGEAVTYVVRPAYRPIDRVDIVRSIASAIHDLTEQLEDVITLLSEGDQS